MSTVLNIGIILSFFLSVLLFAKKDKALTDNILSLWLVTIGIHLTGYYLNYNGYWEIYPHLIGITTPLPFLYGPFLYLYLVYSLQKSNHLKPIDYLHFAPALFSWLYARKMGGQFILRIEDTDREINLVVIARSGQ